MLNRLKAGLTALLLVSALSAYAAPKVELAITVQKDVTVVDKDGKKTTQRVDTKEAVQGDKLFYIIHYKNAGDEAAKAVQLDNPIADGTSYLDGSAWGKNARIEFSIDSGKSFAMPLKLMYEVKNAQGKVEKHVATPKQYNAIRWVIEEIKPGAAGEAGFTVTVN